LSTGVAKNPLIFAKAGFDFGSADRKPREAIHRPAWSTNFIPKITAATKSPPTILPAKVSETIKESH
jgi:hypothetical protein